MTAPIEVSEEAAEIGEEIAEALGEVDDEQIELVGRCVASLGEEACRQLLVQTWQVESTGGLLTLDGSNRRRTAGGVFFWLVKQKAKGAAQRAAIFWRPPQPEPPQAEQQQAVAQLAATLLGALDHAAAAETVFDPSCDLRSVPATSCACEAVLLTGDFNHALREQCTDGAPGTPPPTAGRATSASRARRATGRMSRRSRPRVSGVKYVILHTGQALVVVRGAGPRLDGMSSDLRIAAPHVPSRRAHRGRESPAPPSSRPH